MWVLVRKGADAGHRFEVAGDPVVVGRGDEAGLRLADGNVSRRHAVLEPLEDGRVRVRDLGSANGTFVDGQRVETATLEGGEQLQMGDSVMLVTREGAGAETVVGAPGRTGDSAVRALLQGSAIRRALQADSTLRQVLAAPRRARRTAVLSGAGAAGLVLGVLFATGVLPPEDERSAADVVEEVAPATALVEVLDADGARASTGTGWVLDAREALVVTNAHVLNQGASARVALAGRTRDAQVVGVAPCEDLAVLRVPGATGLRQLELGSQAALRRGDPVVAIGYPGNASLADELSTTEGIVSIVRTRYREPAPDVPEYPNVVQTDAALNPGNSGGPLVDLEGRLVGVNSAGRAGRGAAGIQGQGYAIGVDRVRAVVPSLRDGTSWAWPGFAFEYPDPRELEDDGLPAGLLARDVRDDSAAGRAGLADGDLIVSVGGRPVTGSLASWCAAAAGLRTGREVRLEAIAAGSGARRTLAFRLP